MLKRDKNDYGSKAFTVAQKRVITMERRYNNTFTCPQSDHMSYKWVLVLFRDDCSTNQRWLQRKGGISKLFHGREFSKVACVPVLPTTLLLSLLPARPSFVVGHVPWRRVVWMVVYVERKDRSSLGPSRSIGICPSDVELDGEARSTVVRPRSATPAETCRHCTTAKIITNR